MIIHLIQISIFIISLSKVILMDEDDANDSDISLDSTSIPSEESDSLVNLQDVPYSTTESRQEESVDYEVSKLIE